MKTETLKKYHEINYIQFLMDFNEFNIQLQNFTVTMIIV